MLCAVKNHSNATVQQIILLQPIVQESQIHIHCPLSNKVTMHNIQLEIISGILEEYKPPPCVAQKTAAYPRFWLHFNGLIL